MAELSSKYELSVWEDVNADWSTNGLGYFTEKKLAVIGADNSQNKIFAYDISLNENINGEKTLTFSLPSKYRNEEGDLLDNPLLTYLAAERKVKLRDGEYLIQSSTAAEIAAELEEEDTDKIWYDFIVKDITEDSE